MKSESYDKGTLFDFGVSVSVNDFLTSEDLADGLVAEGISDWQVDSVIQQYETCMDFIDWEEERRDASDRNFLDQQTGLSFLVNLEQS